MFTRAELEAMAASSDRSVLLAAVRAEQIAYDDIGWDNTVPMVFQFIRRDTNANRGARPEGGLDTAADPIGAILDKSLSDALYRMAAMLHDSSEARDKIARPGFDYGGVGLILEGWLPPDMALAKHHKGRIDARFIAGMTDDGYLFTVARVRDQEPVALMEDLRVDEHPDLNDGLFALNQALLVAYKRPRLA